MANVVRHPDNQWFLRDGPLVPQQVEDPSTMEESPGFKRMVEMGRHAKDEIGSFWEWLQNFGADDSQKTMQPGPAEVAATETGSPHNVVPEGIDPFTLAAGGASALASKPDDVASKPDGGLAGLLAPYMKEASEIVPGAGNRDNPYINELYDLYKQDKERARKDMTAQLMFGIASAKTTNPWVAIGQGGQIALAAKEEGMNRYRQALGMMAKRTDDMYVQDENRKLKEIDVALKLLAADQKNAHPNRDFLEKAYLEKIKGIMANEALTQEEKAAQIRAVDEAIAAGNFSVLTGIPVSGVYSVSD